MAAFKTNLELNFVDRFSRRFGRALAVLNKANAKVGSLNRTLNRAGTGFRNLGRGMAGVGRILTASVTAPIVIAGGFMIKAASDAEETADKFGDVFKGLGGESAAAVARLGESFKLADSTSQELLSTTGDLLIGLGLTREKALELSESVVSLSADVTSFKNVTGGVEAAAISLTKALLGERESLKTTFKTSLTEEEILARARKIAQEEFKKGIILTKQQAKAMSLLAIVTERNKDAVGNFQKTQFLFANTLRTAGERLKELNESFGKILLPTATKALRVFIDIAAMFKNLSERTKKNIVVFAAMAAVLGPVLVIGGALVTSLGFMLIAWTTLVPVITAAAFALGIALGPFLAIAAAVAALVAILGVGIIVSPRMRSAMFRLAEAFRPVIKFTKALFNAFAALFGLEGGDFFNDLAVAIEKVAIAMELALQPWSLFADIINELSGKGPSFAGLAEAATPTLIRSAELFDELRGIEDPQGLGRTSSITTVPAANEAFRNVNNNNVDVKTEIKVERGGNVTGRTLVNGQERDSFDTGNMIPSFG